MIAAATSGWAIVGVCATVAGSGTAMVMLLWRLLRGVARFEDRWPVLDEIASDFKPNHGSSLRDQVDQLVAGQTHALAAHRDAASKLDELHSYAHGSRHDILAQIAVLRVADQATGAVVARLRETVEELRQTRLAIAAAAAAPEQPT